MLWNRNGIFRKSCTLFLNNGYCTRSKKFNDPFCNIPESIASRIGTNLHLKQHHPLQIIKTKIQMYFNGIAKNSSLEPEYKVFDHFEPIVSTKRCFDDLLTPKDHISRQVSDTYYVDKSTVLRAHTSAHQTELMEKHEKAFLVAGDVYRRDEIDRSHYPIFHQMEGVRLFPELKDSDMSRDEQLAFVSKHLKSTLEGMVAEIFGKVEMRWVDAYFPFTTPSFELEILYNGEWLEVLGSGVVHPKIITKCGLGDEIGWAFGLGLERLAMVLFDIPDIRLFWSNDERFLSQFTNGVISKFKPFSKYPPCYKDVSFWVANGEFYENDVFEVIRNVGQDIVEEVKLIDEFTHPKNGKVSKCYRIVYRHMSRNLTNEAVDQLQLQVREALVQNLHVELR